MLNLLPSNAAPCSITYIPQVRRPRHFFWPLRSILSASLFKALHDGTGGRGHAYDKRPILHIMLCSCVTRLPLKKLMRGGTQKHLSLHTKWPNFLKSLLSIIELYCSTGPESSAKLKPAAAPRRRVASLAASTSAEAAFEVAIIRSPESQFVHSPSR